MFEGYSFEARFMRIALKLFALVVMLICICFAGANLITFAKAKSNVSSGVVVDKYIRYGFLGLGGGEPNYYLVVESEIEDTFIFGNTTDTSVAVTYEEYNSTEIGENYEF